MTLYYLKAHDFAQENGHLVANIGGITFTMFHSQKCGHCVNFLPEFKTLPSLIRGINFCICSVDNENASILQKCAETSTPISAVPKFILYSDGIPYVEYSGPRNRQRIIEFLQEIIEKLNQKQEFARPRRSRNDENHGAPRINQVNNSMPTRPTAVAPSQAPPDNSGKQYNITPSTGVKEYETSYGRPYNTLNEMEFLEYENAYKQQMNGNKKK